MPEKKEVIKMPILPIDPVVFCAECGAQLKETEARKRVHKWKNNDREFTTVEWLCPTAPCSDSATEGEHKDGNV